MTSDAQLREFVQQHKVCWEVQPLREMVKDEGVRLTGLELHLFAQWLPPPPGTTDLEWFTLIHGRTAEIAEQVVPRAAPGMHVEVEPPHVETHLRPETEWAPEIEVQVLLTPPHPDAQPSRQEMSVVMVAVERGMAALGVHPKAWPHAGR